ncbi:PfkB family carbohydrate kinase [Gordonia sp. Z-3]|uniref:PfkB family carbohydrate kinase n=1 Tax=Gordonia sp. Z-3 TaxID=3115408 RepID=UPI002E2B1219|nr:PfkB family carbohydrate kinase [Gordonia sp. Z-3]MED5803830.1 PfkB family carbohydrate kinase [Gordonia sp. Z-3]
MTPGVLVIGALNVDFVVAAERLPRPGETVVGLRADRYGGGKGANAAVAAARAGAAVRYCGAVGADESGTLALADLRAEGVDVADVQTVDEMTTGTALIVVDPDGENQIAVGAGANAVIDPVAVRAAVARAASWAGCVLVSTEISPAAVAAAVAAAAEYGISCVLNTAPATPGLLRLFGYAPVVTPNASELCDLHSLVDGRPHATVEQKAARVAEHTNAPVIVTLGGDGALVVEPGGETTALRALAVGEVKDTTGAGDTFNGVLAHALAAGLPLLSAITQGVAAASLSVRHVGARAGMPTGDEIAIALESAEMLETDTVPR